MNTSRYEKEPYIYEDTEPDITEDKKETEEDG